MVTVINREPVEVTNTAGDVIRGDVRYGGMAARRPVVIVCHSFMSFKDWGFFPYVGERLAAAGYVSFVFNFSHNGVAGDDVRITDFKGFEENTFSQEVDDLLAVLGAIRGGSLGAYGADGNRIALLGHSRGGAIAVLAAAADRQLGVLATWSAIAKLDRWTPHQKHAWRKRGYLPLSKDTTASPLRLGLGLLADLEERGERLDIDAAASRVEAPWLIVHGREDVTVPLREAESLYAAGVKGRTELRVLDHVGHLYHAASRSEDGYRTLDRVLEITIQWFDRHWSI